MVFVTEGAGMYSLPGSLKDHPDCFRGPLRVEYETG